MFTVKSMRSHAIKNPCIFFSSQQHNRFLFRSSLVPRDSFTTASFFKIIQTNSRGCELRDMTALLQNRDRLKTALDQINKGVIGEYLNDNFIFWLNTYATQAGAICSDYLAGKIALDAVCKDFIRFCFNHKIYLDPAQTLNAFKKHNELSINAIQNELEKLTSRQEINLLGFGLDEGHYEENIAKFLLSAGKAEKVNLFGFDPYAKRNAAIKYLSIPELNSTKINFDLIIARWALHHVEKQYRWSLFTNCVNRCRPGAEVLIVEHGYLEDVSLLNRKLSSLLNATFDVVANIGLRPGYFLNSKDIGGDFFIDYLEQKDFSAISAQASVNLGVKIYNIGPEFPNQTICKMSIA